jgi:arginine N-succinyltransferase
MFAMEDMDTGGVIGTSQVRAHQGGPGNPNWSMKLSDKDFYSPALGQGTTHTVMQLYGDETGPTEIGGLILQPSHRGHRARPGRLLSFVRFHYMALHRAVFADRIIAEMMPPVTSEGDNAFWDHFGRKFIPVRYAEADRFCQFNRRFISELLPKEEIFITLFPLEIQNMVGVVSRETLPARRMLESIGFTFRRFVDPFDGGPHLEAETDSLTLIKETRTGVLGKALAAERCEGYGIVSVTTEDGEFRAVEASYSVAEGVGGGGGVVVRVPEEVARVLGGGAGMMAWVTPLKRMDGGGGGGGGVVEVVKGAGRAGGGGGSGGGKKKVARRGKKVARRGG